MARNLVLSLDGKSSESGFAKLERRKLYGIRKREAVDRDGQRCSQAKSFAGRSTPTV